MSLNTPLIPTKTGRDPHIKIITFLAFLCGASAASMYYVQPLLGQIAHDLYISHATVGLAVTATLCGNCCGLIFIVPLGDRLNRKNMLIALSLLQVIALAVAANALNFTMLCISLFCMGISGGVAMLSVSFAADISLAEFRGKTTGIVMAGLLLGILLSRTISGTIAQFIGWRKMLMLGSGVMIILFLGVLFFVTDHARKNSPIEAEGSYGSLIVSLSRLVKKNKILRERMFLGAIIFFGFNILWTGLTLGLGSIPYSYGVGLIGLFGLAGAAGTVAAKRAGVAVDNGKIKQVTIGSWIAAAIAWVILGLGAPLGGISGIIAIILALIIFDAGSQGLNIGSQAVLFHTIHDSRSRIMSCYMTANMVAGALGSALTGILWRHAHWLGFSAVGFITSLLALAFAWRFSNRETAELGHYPVNG